MLETIYYERKLNYWYYIVMPETLKVCANE